MSDLEKARELEAGRYKAALGRLEAEIQPRIAELTREGKPYTGALFRIRLAQKRAAIDCRIGIRRDLVPHVPELGSALELTALANQIGDDITRFWSEWQNRGIMIDGYLLAELREHARNGIGVLRGEIDLNLHKKPGSSGPFSVNTGGGPAILNLGVIYGNVHQVIETVGASGQAELAQALSRITDAINAEEGLGDERAALLEQVGFVAEQSTAPTAERKTGAVKGMLLGLRAGVQDVANVAQMLSVAGPVIARHFGLQWPI